MRSLSPSFISPGVKSDTVIYIRPGRAIVGRIVTVVVAAVLAALVFEVVRERWRVVSLSLHDPLTGLPNRRLLEERIERSVAWAASFADVATLKRVAKALGGDRATVNDLFAALVAGALRAELDPGSEKGASMSLQFVSFKR